MRPVDPRLLRYARATRGFLAASVALGLLGALLVIAQATLIAEIVVRAVDEGADAGELREPLLLLAAVSLGRALVSWLTELAAHRSSAAVKSELRTRLLTHATALGPGWLSQQRTGELATLATRGIDALDDYFARYLPQLGLAVVVPVAVLARVVGADWISAAIIAGTLPLIPVFMTLIGWATQAHMDRRWRQLSRLSGHFLDVVAGLPTLKVFGRSGAQAAGIRAVTADYRRATLRTLRLAFLSSFALELLATISVALVAVSIGMRLVHGELDLRTGLVVLILAPEAYLPLRQVGAQYHAAAEGLAAAGQVFDVLEAPPRRGGARQDGTAQLPAPDVRFAPLTLDGVTVRHPGRDLDSLSRTSLTVHPGETVALVGPSGAGKTTLLNTVLGFEQPAAGRVLVDGTDLAAIDPASWHRQIAWLPQRPGLFAGTVADNVRLARPTASDPEVAEALRQAAAEDVSPTTVLGERGAGLSAGQRQRVALARAFLADRPLLVLDEATAALDGATEAAVVDAVRRLAAGRTVLLVAHRPALLGIADRVVRLAPATPPVPDANGPVRAGTLAEATADAGTGADPDPGAGADARAASRKADTDPAKSGDASGDGTADGDGRVGGPLAQVRAAARPLRGRLALALLLGALALGSGVALMATSGWLISRAAEQPPVLYLMVAVTLTRAFGIGRAVFRYGERLVSHDAALRVLADLRVHVYRRLERLAPAGLRGSRDGDLLTRLVRDVEALQDYFLRWLLPAAAALVVSLAAVGFTGWLLPEAGALLAVGLLLAGVGVPALTARLSRRTEGRLAPLRGDLGTRVLDLLTGTAELTVYGALGARMRTAGAADAQLTGLAARSSALTGLAAGLSALTAGLTVTAVAWVGVTAVANGQLEGVWLAAAVLTALAAFEAVTGLPLAVQQRQRTRRSAERVREVLDAPDPITEPQDSGRSLTAPEDASEGSSLRPGHTGALTRTTGAAEPPVSPFPLSVRGLTVRHPDQPAPALRDFSLELEPGRRVAVLGPSGSGKTTLAHALLRFLDPEDGTYLLGGVPAGRLPSDAVRRFVGLCAQDAHLFDSTLRENLRLARPTAGDAELRAALAAARLDDWVGTLPEGLDTDVGEHGARLSGGQRQRLALARALLADFPVLVLDEPAEHLDLPTADALTADLLAATEGRTTVLITHRLQGLSTVDEVIVLDRSGRTAQRGTYRELAASEGPFRAMLDREAAVAAPPEPDGPGPRGPAPEREPRRPDTRQLGPRAPVA
ncbi:thiol reductant ABC exporter subunit CydD [Streptomyces sp. AJS327]|uniref:thiol reductant ABC exporter subunit CydD n=1 Tax=Streptomyces sp. AJS327 TaxID=2545265 RepID=UPI0015DE4CAA|nr:thiol reductant ABC exporter subunit CydD [Streptomyces sp. AJS327]MBA0052880.1 thiol reductant ABC exporter subunit CydD [Streptomyces sp. AJS327]